MRIGKILSISVFALFFFLGCLSGNKKPESILKMVYIEGGVFDMGSDEGKSTEQPVHSVTVDSFFMSAYEITQGQWLNVTGTAPAADTGAGENYPVYNITWYDAVDFCNKLSLKEELKPCYSGSGITIGCDFKAGGYRLPTEAEWEYAAKGGKNGETYLFSGSDNPGEVAWSTENSESSSHEVGLKQPNSLGIYDLSGNVWEWCWDWYDAKYYSKSAMQNPQGPETGTYRVLRGGSKGINANGLRNTNRYFGAHRSDNSTGFRVVRTAG